MKYFLNNRLYTYIKTNYKRINRILYESLYQAEIPLNLSYHVAYIVDTNKLSESILDNLIYHKWLISNIFKHQKLSDTFLSIHLPKIVYYFRNHNINYLIRHRFSERIITKFARLLPIQDIFYNHTYDVEFVMNTILSQTHKYISTRLLSKYKFSKSFLDKFKIDVDQYPMFSNLYMGNSLYS